MLFHRRRGGAYGLLDSRRLPPTVPADWITSPDRQWTSGVQQARIVADDLEIVGWRLDRERVEPGDVLLLDLYMRLAGDAHIGDSASAVARPYYLPWARLGDTTYHFTTDSRFRPGRCRNK